MIMKQISFSYHELVLSLVCLLLLSSYSTSASRLLIPHRYGEEMVDAAASLSQTEDIGQKDSWNLLMDGEKCGNEVEDEECFKRRMMSEAHLDYIYTQHQNP